MAEIKKEETSEKKIFKPDPFLLMWVVAMVLAIVFSLMNSSMSDKDGNLSFVRGMFCAFAIAVFVVGWIIAIIGLIFFAVKKSQNSGIDWYQ